MLQRDFSLIGPQTSAEVGLAGDFEALVQNTLGLPGCGGDGVELNIGALIIRIAFWGPLYYETILKNLKLV